MRPGVALLITVLLLAACGGTSSSPAVTSTPAGTGTTLPTTAGTDVPPAPADATPGTTLTACQLVTAGDIETALGLDSGTVSEGTLQQKGTVLDPASNECRYQDDAWGGLVVSVTPTDGANTYDAVAKTGTGGEPLAGIGDAALWFDDSDRGYFLKGSVLVLLQFSHLVDGRAFRDPTVALGTAAVARI